MGVVTTRHAGVKGPVATKDTKKLTDWVDLLDQPLSQKNLFKNFNPLPLKASQTSPSAQEAFSTVQMILY